MHNSSLKALLLADSNQMGSVISSGEINYLETWLFGKSPFTIKNYLFELKEFLHWYGEYAVTCGRPRPKITDLTSDVFNTDIGEILYTRTKAKRSRARAALGSLFAFLFKTGVIKKNPFDLVSSIKLQSKIFERYLSRAEVNALIAAGSTARDQLILKVLYQGGFRVAELVDLKWNDLSFSNEDTVFVAFKGKGSKKRMVQLFGSVVTDLKAHQKINTQKSEFLFYSRETNLKPLDKTRVNQIVKQAALKAQIKKQVSPYWLRHASI